MDRDLEQARAILQAEGCTCVLYKDGVFHKSTQRGIKPLLDFLDSGTDLRGFSAADKVVGKATAFLYCLLGVRAVYTSVISRAALQVLTEQGIEMYYDILTDAILNRCKDGFCPMETATRDITSPEDALAAIRKALQAIQANKS